MYSLKNIVLEPSNNFMYNKPQIFYHVVNNTTSSLRYDSEVSIPNNVSIWHSRLGHANPRVTHNILAWSNIHLSYKNSTSFCNSCYLGKSHKLYAPLSQTKYIDYFDLIHTDLWGPSYTPYSNGHPYYVSFVYAFTRYTWIHMLKQKSDAFCAFKLFQSYVRTQFNANIKEV